MSVTVQQTIVQVSVTEETATVTPSETVIAVDVTEAVITVTPVEQAAPALTVTEEIVVVSPVLEAITVQPLVGITDHNALGNLGVGDPHTQYHTDARGDARYWSLSTDLATQAELDAHAALTTTAHGGIVPQARTLTINGTAFDLSADRSWTITGGVSGVTATSPLQSSGGATPNISFATQSANTILAGPASGGAAAPSFRALVAADLPSIASGLSGVLPPANGGTGIANSGNLAWPGGGGTAALLGTANSFTIGPQTIATGATGNKGVIVNGAVGQTATLQEWQVNGVVQGQISAAGKLRAKQYETGTPTIANDSNCADFTWTMNADAGGFHVQTGINISLALTGTVASNAVFAKGITVNATYAGSQTPAGGANLWGAFYQVYNNSSVTFDTITGFLARVGTNTSQNNTTNNVYAARAGLDSTAASGKVATITNVYDFSAGITGGFTRTAVTNRYGMYIENDAPGTGSSLTNQYGIVVQSLTSGASLNKAIETNAGLVVLNEGGDATSDVRVEGDTDANLLFMKASTDRVGIGTNAPNEKLEVVGTVRADGLRLDITPTAETPVMTHTFTISLNGTNYKVPVVAA